jgi:hypothetical protein
VKWRLVVRPRAESDLREAQNWYENQRAGLGAEFLVEIDATIRVLIRDPQRHPVYYRGFRRALAGVFPTSCFTECKMTRSLYFAFYMCAVTTLGFFDQAN